MTAKTIFDLPVHPAAEVFPMIADDELNELAEDIKANGLIQPIVVKDGVLIDGRNRREACKRAGVEPATEELNGADPVAYILSSNINRRHMTKGARAMAVAMIYPETAQGKRSTSLKNKEVNSGYISQARTVLRYAPELVTDVVNGAESLGAAYTEASNRKHGEGGREIRLTALREKHSDLADRVKDENITLEEGEALAKERRERERENVTRVCVHMKNIGVGMGLLTEDKIRASTIDVLRNNPSEVSFEDTKIAVEQWIEALTKTLKGMQ